MTSWKDYGFDLVTLGEILHNVKNHMVGGIFEDIDEVTVIDRNGRECAFWYGDDDPKFDAEVTDIIFNSDGLTAEIHIDFDTLAE